MDTFIETLVKEIIARVENGDSVDGTVHAVSSLAGIRDPYTADHQHRVGVTAGFIAKEIGLSDWQVKGIYVAGLLHDVGKSAVPLKILNKPSKLTVDEFSIVKTHPQVGCDILKDIVFPWPVIQAIMQHHERLDGSGYPMGLSGYQIVLEARILGVVDVVDAMSYSRPYRSALGLEAALEEIKSKRDILYDAHIVNAYLKLLGQDALESGKTTSPAAVRQPSSATA
jgi:putative nucleotidyltransferase with HDIG domain